MTSWSGLDRGPITAAAAEAEQDRLFDRPARPMSPELARLFAHAEAQRRRRPTTTTRRAAPQMSPIGYISTSEIPKPATKLPR